MHIAHAASPSIALEKVDEIDILRSAVAGPLAVLELAAKKRPDRNVVVTCLVAPQPISATAGHPGLARSTPRQNIF